MSVSEIISGLRESSILYFKRLYHTMIRSGDNWLKFYFLMCDKQAMFVSGHLVKWLIDYYMIMRIPHTMITSGHLVAIKKFVESEDDPLIKKIALREIRFE